MLYPVKGCVLVECDIDIDIQIYGLQAVTGQSPISNLVRALDHIFFTTATC